MTDLDKTDARLLLALCAKPRATGVELATTLGLSRNTVQARLGRWDDKGSLTPIDHRIPPKSLGRPLQAFVTAQVNQHTLAAVTEHLRTIPEVLEVFGLSGAADMHIRIAAVDADWRRADEHVDCHVRADSVPNQAVARTARRRRPPLSTPTIPAGPIPTASRNLHGPSDAG